MSTIEFCFFPVHVNKQVMTSSIKACNILQGLLGLGVDVASLMMAKTNQKLVNVSYRAGHLSDDTFRIEWKICYPCVQYERELSRTSLGIQSVDPSLKRWMPHIPILFDAS